VDPPDLTGREGRVCADLLRKLPATVDGAERRDVDPAQSAAAAWGDPAIVLRCGVDRPAGLDEFATCQEVNGVGWWVPEEQMTGAPTPLTMTTVDREVLVEVSLPETHWPPANTMVDLADAVGEAVPQDSPCV
jgi:hypothetical protein